MWDLKWNGKCDKCEKSIFDWTRVKLGVGGVGDSGVLTYYIGSFSLWEWGGVGDRVGWIWADSLSL